MTILIISLLSLSKTNLQDGNGSIENDELHGFLKDLMELVEEVIKRLKCIDRFLAYHWSEQSFVAIFEPPNEKTIYLHMRKQRRRSASRLPRS